jgi:hypothetical protein
VLEEQVQRAMDELKDTRKALEMDVAREEEFTKSIADMRYTFSWSLMTLYSLYSVLSIVYIHVCVCVYNSL